jgi:hypothetical protein
MAAAEWRKTGHQAYLNLLALEREAATAEVEAKVVEEDYRSVSDGASLSVVIALREDDPVDRAPRNRQTCILCWTIKVHGL